MHQRDSGEKVIRHDFIGSGTCGSRQVPQDLQRPTDQSVSRETLGQYRRKSAKTWTERCDESQWQQSSLRDESFQGNAAGTDEQSRRLGHFV